MNLQEVLSQVISECWSNPNFKAEFIANPQEAIESLTDQTVVLPEGMESIQVVDESNPTTVYINIPAEPNLDNVELTENELELVSGGCIPEIKFGRCGGYIYPKGGGWQTPPVKPGTPEPEILIPTSGPTFPS